VEYLFKDYPYIFRQLVRAKRILLLLDYDGTLTPIAATPEKAVLDGSMRRLLMALAKQERFSIGIISGRKLSEVRDMVKVPGIYYAGNHGLEISGPDLDYLNPEGSAARPYLTRIYQALDDRLGGIDGLILEDKGLSLSLHYRLVEASQFPLISQVFDQVCEPYVAQGRIKVTRGKKVLEIRPPVNWNKGRAVMTLRGLKGGPSGLLTIYVGDDQTDEDAFSVLSTGPDISVLVGNADQDSQAKYFLNDVGEVRRFLLKLKGSLKN
jgi:trehalose-phosphatase